MKVDYSERWLIGENEPLNPIDVEAARHRHIGHRPYAAIVGGRENPRCVVDIANDWISVIFLDGRRRQYLRYDFEKNDSGRLFLKTAYYWEYRGDGQSPTARKMFSFAKDGHVTMESCDANSGDVQNREVMTNVDGNWELYPNFGEYDSLCKEDRNQITGG